ncbi:hypothetical protein E3N88_38998 [Mikania micrantha]|uniref:Uncharacterized protein n=1 Tax=Mikania micrantha TaxID=192012 RepID=A0A5N6LVR8_9ASTR|nr:hypothetical protein E3N88_38998 [Mikania micrantha]
MELNSIKDAFDRVTKKQKLSSSKSQEAIEQMSQEIELALSRIQSATPQSDHNLIISELKAKLKEMTPLGQLEGPQKELNLALSKYTKLLEKQFNPDISKSYRNVDFDFHTKLTACILWTGKLESSPYTELLSPTHWVKLAHELAQQFCNLLGESIQSPLSMTVAAGVQGLPTLLKLMNVMAGKKQEWQCMKQLPVPVDLDQEFQFHSIFVCPVSRDQASEDNPPMLLSCGHVLCKQSITKLSKNNSTRPFKCPYCPTEVQVGQCRKLHF